MNLQLQNLCKEGPLASITNPLGVGVGDLKSKLMSSGLGEGLGALPNDLRYLPGVIQLIATPSKDQSHYAKQLPGRDQDLFTQAQ